MRTRSLLAASVACALVLAACADDDDDDDRRRNECPRGLGTLQRTVDGRVWPRWRG